jgi:hypothetical protein
MIKVGMSLVLLWNTLWPSKRERKNLIKYSNGFAYKRNIMRRKEKWGDISKSLRGKKHEQKIKTK